MCHSPGLEAPCGYSTRHVVWVHVHHTAILRENDVAIRAPIIALDDAAHAIEMSPFECECPEEHHLLAFADGRMKRRRLRFTNTWAARIDLLDGVHTLALRTHESVWPHHT